MTIEDAVAAAARYRSAEPRAATEGMIALVTLAPFVLCLLPALVVIVLA